MNVNDFVQLRQKEWERLKHLLDSHQGRDRLSAAEVKELGTLYRAVTSDLALARRDFPDQRVTLYLNRLLTQAHGFIYQEQGISIKFITNYFLHKIPQAFRQTSRFVLAAFLVFIIPAIVGFSAGLTNPAVADTLGLSSERELLARESTWTNIPPSERPYASTFIMSNNIRVALLAFGGGMLFGIFAVYLLAFNGLTIGAVLGLAAHYGQAHVLLNFMVGHGVLELSIIFITGGAGLCIGWALLNPGLYSRRDAAVIAARHTVPLVVLAIFCLVAAGLIEGFISPSVSIGFPIKLLIGGTSGLLLFAYLGFVERLSGQTA